MTERWVVDVSGGGTEDVNASEYAGRLMKLDEVRAAGHGPRTVTATIVVEASSSDEAMENAQRRFSELLGPGDWAIGIRSVPIPEALYDSGERGQDT